MNKPWIGNFYNSTIGESIGVKGHNNFEGYVGLSKVYILLINWQLYDFEGCLTHYEQVDSLKHNSPPKKI